MKILLVHNHYLQPGGEDTVFEIEEKLLKQRGHKVVTFIEDNARLNEINPLNVAINTVWSRETQKHLRQLIKEVQPDIVHFHNTFLRISPAAYYTAKEMGLPVIQTLHNYRLICPGALLMRDGKVCEKCVGKTIPWPGVTHGCWQDSKVRTTVVAAMLTIHNLLETWTKKVDIYIALTEFAKNKFVEGGIPADKIIVKPNFVSPDPGLGTHTGGYALFVGRLSREKGIKTLLSAWQKLKGIPLKLVGDGPMREEIKKQVEQEQLNVEILGRRAREEVFYLMKEARLLLFPSEWYENFPMTIVEAFACGLPILASRLGAMVEIIEDGRTGLLFEPGNAEDLAEKIAWLWDHPKEMEEMRREARREYEEKYTAERNYELLIDIYRKAIERAKPDV